MKIFTRNFETDQYLNTPHRQIKFYPYLISKVRLCKKVPSIFNNSLHTVITTQAILCIHMIIFVLFNLGHCHQPERSLATCSLLLWSEPLVKMLGTLIVDFVVRFAQVLPSFKVLCQNSIIPGTLSSEILVVLVYVTEY